MKNLEHIAKSLNICTRDFLLLVQEYINLERRGSKKTRWNECKTFDLISFRMCWGSFELLKALFELILLQFFYDCKHELLHNLNFFRFHCLQKEQKPFEIAHSVIQKKNSPSYPTLNRFLLLSSLFNLEQQIFCAPTFFFDALFML